jgi:cytochrome oxidase Cu insertion factor (SCO1/SenC/PrrC family)
MSQISMKRAFVVFLLWIGMAAGPVQALGPVDGGGLPPTDLERVRVGSPAPDFTLEDEKGQPLTLSQLRSKKNVVLVFYRGHW